MSCQRGVRWFQFITNAAVINKTSLDNVSAQIQRRRPAAFSHIRCLPEAIQTPLRLAVETRTGRCPDNMPKWKRRRGQPCHAWVQQIEADTGLSTDAALKAVVDCHAWRALRRVTGQAN